MCAMTEQATTSYLQPTTQVGSTQVIVLVFHSYHAHYANSPGPVLVTASAG